MNKALLSLLLLTTASSLSAVTIYAYIGYTGDERVCDKWTVDTITTYQEVISFLEESKSLTLTVKELTVFDTPENPVTFLYIDEAISKCQFWNCHRLKMPLRLQWRKPISK